MCLTQIRVPRALHLCLLGSGNIQPSSSRTRSYLFPLKMSLFPRLSLSPQPTFWPLSLYHCYGSSLSFSFCHYFFFIQFDHISHPPTPPRSFPPLLNSFQGCPPLKGSRENQNKQKPNKTKKIKQNQKAHTHRKTESPFCVGSSMRHSNISRFPSLCGLSLLSLRISV